uniref:Uncharacterized protein n=1 Tax=Romanomermis culicivorax TaxID=13658 RepID=A0A915K0I0_ROMCU
MLVDCIPLYSVRSEKAKYKNQKVDKKTLFDCESKTGYMNKSLDEYARSCYFSVTSSDIQDGLGACSCDHFCHNSLFGYDIGEPCVAIGLTKVIDWRPGKLFLNRDNFYDCHTDRVEFRCFGKIEVYCHAIADNIVEEERHEINAEKYLSKHVAK